MPGRRWAVAAATALVLAVSAAPAQALTATPPNAVLALSLNSPNSASNIIDTAAHLGSSTPSSGTAPERFFVKTGVGVLVTSLRSGANGTDLAVGTTTTSGTSSYTWASPVRVVPLSCGDAWSTTLIVKEVVRSGGAITTLAADWATTCYLGTTSVVQNRAVGSIRFGSSLPYGAVGVGTWTSPGALPTDRTESVTIPVTSAGDGATVTSIALASGQATITGETCTGAGVVTAAAPCSVTLLVDPSDQPAAASGSFALDVTMSDGRTARLARTVTLRPPMPAPILHVYPVSGGTGIGFFEAYADDVITVVRRPAAGGAWTTVGTTTAALPVGGGPARVIDSTAVAGSSYEYAASATNADARFSSPQSAPVAVKRPETTPVPTTRTRLAVHAASGTQAPNLSDTDSGLTTSVVTVGDGLQTHVGLVDASSSTVGALVVDLMPGPGVYDFPLGGVQSVTAQSMVTNLETGSRAVVRSVLYADDGTLLALDASLRGPHGQAEVRFRTGSSIAIPVLAPGSASFLADPSSTSSAQVFTLTNTGPDSVTVGPTSFSGAAAGSFTATACSSGSLVAAATCTLSATYHGAASPVSTTAELSVATTAGSAAEPTYATLTARTTSLPSAPEYLNATRVPGRVIVQWGAPADDGGRPVTSGFLERSLVGSGTWQPVTQAGGGAYYGVDADPPAGDVLYRVSAVTSRGTSPASPSAQAVAATMPLVIAGSAADLGTSSAFGLHEGSTFSDVVAPLQVDGHEHESPALTPDGTTVVFSRAATAGVGQFDYDMWRLGVAPGSTPVQLTSMPGAEVDAEVSPDGTHIAFTYYPPLGAADLQPQVWTMTTDGAAQTLRLTGFSHPSWLSSSVLVASDDRTANGSLVKVTIAEAVTGAPVALPGTAGGFDPAASPDGSAVAFVSAAGVPSTVALATGSVTEFEGAWSQEDVATPTWLSPVATAWARSDAVSGAPLRGIMLPSYSAGPGAELAAFPVDDGTAPVIGAVSAYVRNGGTLTVAVSGTGSPRAAFTVACAVDGAADVPCTIGLAIAGLAVGPHAVRVTASDVFGNTATADRAFVVDDVAPGVTTLTVSAYTLTTAATASFRAVDASPVVFEVRQRSWPLAATVPKPFVTLTTGQSATSRSIAVPIATRVCVQARAKDLAGNVGAWSVERCTTTPLDDRRMKRATTGWASASGSAFYAATATFGKRTGLRLVSTTGIGASRLALVATTCPACGSVIVYHRGIKVGTVSLRSATTVARKVILLPQSVYRYGIIEVRTTSARLVRIDGVIPLR